MASGIGNDAGVERVADRYLKREVLGEGTYGVVFKAIDTKTGNTVAIKKIRLGKYKEGVNFTALREIKLLKEMKDPDIIELIDAFPCKGNLHLTRKVLQTGPGRPQFEKECPQDRACRCPRGGRHAPTLRRPPHTRQWDFARD